MKELDIVVLTTDVTDHDGTVIPAGTSGTIVGVWRARDGYIVEFAEPEGSLADVEQHEIRLDVSPTG